MRNNHLVPACHRSLDLLSPSTPIALPLSFPLLLLLFPLRGVFCRLTLGSWRPSTSDPDSRTRVSLVDDAVVSMETGYITHVPGDDLRRDLGMRLSKRGRSESGDLGEDDLEHRYLEIRDQASLLIDDHEKYDLEKYDLEHRHLDNKHDPSADHLENRDLRRHDLEEHDLENLKRDESVHLDNADLGRNLDLENASRSPETTPTDSVTSAVTPPPPDRNAYRRLFNSLKLPLRPATRNVTRTRRRHQNVTRYRLVFQSRSSATVDVTPGGSVNLMIIPLGAIFVFIVIGVLHVSRWCIEDIRIADGILAKRHLGPGFIASCPLPRPHPQVGRGSLPAVDRLAVTSSGRSGGANSESDLARLHTRARIQRQTKIVPARSTRSLNGTRERNCERANRKLAIGSDSSIPMTEMTSAVRYCRHAERGRATSGPDGIVESCKRAVGSFLQSHLIVVPVDRNMATGSAVDTRTRNFSSPASSSKTGSSCSESRPLLAHCSSSSDGRMTSSDSNIDVMSPLSVRRRLAGETRYRTKPSCVNSAGNLLSNRIVAVQHARHPVGGRAAGYSHQSSAPAVSKLVHESLNLSFRFFQVPLCSNSSSAKESLDSVFVCGIYADDATPIVATPTSASDALRPDMDVYGAGIAPEQTVSCKPRHQPRPSKERTVFYSVFDRQSSIGEEEGAAKMVRESSQTLNEGPELDCVLFQSHLGAQAEVTQQGRARQTKGCHGDRGDTFRRTRSANELQVLSARDKRTAKCLTA